MITLLTNELPNIRYKIDQLDLSCNGVINITVQNLGTDLISYVFTPIQFQTYFTSYYGQSAFQQYTNQNQVNSISNITLYPYNIFSTQWSNQYGACFSNDVAAAYSSGVITDYSFLSDFKCSQDTSLVSNGGIITRINNNLIYAIGANGINY